MGPTCFAHISNGWDTRPTPPPSQKHASKEVSSEICRKPSIESSTSTPSTDGKETSGISEKALEKVSFRDTLQENSHGIESFDRKTYEAHILKVASETTIIDSMIFDDHSKLYLSSIHSRSQDYSSRFSDSTDDLSLDNWAEDSGLLDETFSSFLPSISKAQPLFDPNHSHLHRNTPDSTLNVSGIKLSCEINLKASVAIKGRSQVKWPLICEIESNYNTQRCNILNFSCNNSFPSPPLPALSQHESFLFESTSSSPTFPKKLDPHSSCLEFFKKPALDHTLGTLDSAPISSSKE